MASPRSELALLVSERDGRVCECLSDYSAVRNHPARHNFLDLEGARTLFADCASS